MEDRYGPRGWTEEPEKNGANIIKGYAKQAHDYTHNVDHEFVEILRYNGKMTVDSFVVRIIVQFLRFFRSLFLTKRSVSESSVDCIILYRIIARGNERKISDTSSTPRALKEKPRPGEVI